jgi:ATP-independent RNA helicase DbpA
MASFNTLPLRADLIANLTTLEYLEMTPIQAASLPPILAGSDVLGQAQTGTGKTAAFGLGVLQSLNVKRFRIQALVLCPTRELADQVASEIRRLGRGTHNVKILTLCGGVPIGPQIGSLAHGAHIIVGTPGRIEEHLRKETLSFADVHTLVLDEADRMLDMGFAPSIDNIMRHVPSKRQTLLFSATFTREITAIANRIMREPVTVDLGHREEVLDIEELWYAVPDDVPRPRAVEMLLMHHRVMSALVFCATRLETQALAEHLAAEGFVALAMHGDLDQRQRDERLIRFANGSATVMVATDVAARGLDIDALGLVVNYHVANDAEVHTHRIGRTGRAGESGIACNLVTDREMNKVERLGIAPPHTIAPLPLPDAACLDGKRPTPAMATLQVDGGRKQKLRPGDILGALTVGKEITGQAVGRIHLRDNTTYIAVQRGVSQVALSLLSEGKIKGRSFRARRIR